MKTMSERLDRRLVKDRKMVTISLRIPEDVVDDLKEIAPTLGFSGYQSLMKTYIGEGLREDLSRLYKTDLQTLTESMRKQGVEDEVISAVMADLQKKIA